MKISLNWLKQYIDLPENPKKLAQILTQHGLEVVATKEYSPLKFFLRGLLIGQVLSCIKHPQADRLQKTTVDIGTDTPIPIICGASNVAVGQKVVVAPVGSTIYNSSGESLKIKKQKIRGEVSQGMLCAENEIGLGTQYAGIMVLTTKLKPGTPIIHYFEHLLDHILEIDITPNRADALSHIGIARELHALLNRQYTIPPNIKNWNPAPDKNLLMQVDIQNHTYCPRYTGITIHNIDIKPSPSWLQHRLQAIDIQPVNNVVDVLQFVMHELGQPLCVYDYEQLIGSQFSIKSLPQGTVFTTLTGEKKTLCGTELMLCDAHGAISMAGIIGSKRTNIHSHTTHIFLECAYFIPTIIQQTAQQHMLTTDTTFRFERGVDPNSTVYALQRACLLFEKIAHGKIQFANFIDIYPQKLKNNKIQVKYQHIHQLIGQNIPEKTIKNLLKKLEITINKENEEGFVAYVPLYRVDILREIDIIEEIIRLYGYHHIHITSNIKLLHRPISSKQKLARSWQHTTASLLAHHGYHEIYTNSMTKSAYNDLIHTKQKIAYIPIKNPLSVHLDSLKQHMVFGGLEAIAYNINRKKCDVKLFEFGKIYIQHTQTYIENKRLGIWITGAIAPPSWTVKSREVVFQDINCIVHTLLAQFNIQKFTIAPCQIKLLQDGISIHYKEQLLGIVGQINSQLLKHFAITQSVFFADINWDILIQHISTNIQYQPIAKYPSVRRDLSLVIDEAVSFSQIKEVIQAAKIYCIQSFNVVNVYQGNHVEKGKKTYTLSFLLQDKTKTLQDKIVDKVMKQLMDVFTYKINAIIRQ